ncbi:MAG TPA: glycoside hydrolase family 2 TIM barrel-domain containing protein [Glycomyces sp.]|nr:glycoside hydrolase family 2 TIM barrel-domain containing protein [Glycomyces sp.]
MARRFTVHERRAVRDLSGIWEFAFLGDADPDTVDIGRIGFDERMAVPGCFDAMPDHAGERGLAAYRLRVPVEREGRHRLAFDGVHHWCRIFWDGRPVRDHAGGFTAFTADVGRAEAGTAELVVLVDNRIGPRSPLHMEHFDWYHFGGIARGAELHRLPETWIEALRVTTEDAREGRFSLRVDYRSDGGAAVPLVVECDGRVLAEETVALDGPGRIERVFTLPGAEPWTPANPALHTLAVRLGEDDMHERFGLRQVSAEGGRIAVNGEPLTLLGFNRHESHPQFGHSQPLPLLLADLQQIRDLGCNFIRGSHYPQDPMFLDLCDELGVCVWSETIGWQYPVAMMREAAFVEAQIEHLDEMVAAAANHPSIIMWGVLNECPSYEAEARPAYERLLGRLKELDPSRPVTYATLNVYDDRCLDLADVVSVNTYPGWYFGGVDEVPKELDRIAAHLEGEGLADKPLIVSEIGAGAVPGWRDAHGGMWTEEYQSELLAAAIGHVLGDRDRFAGLAIWLLGDFRTTEHKEMLLKRPRSANDKGVVDEYRRPKQAYRTVRELFRGA